jgi:uncharacterized protein (TIGR02246 family)
VKFLNLVLLLSVSGALFTCETVEKTETPDPAQIKQEIQDLENAYAEALNNDNVEAILELYAENVVTMRPGEPMMTGKTNLKTQIENSIAADTTNSTVVFEVVNVITSGNLVIETGTDVTTLPSGDKKMGKYLAVWEKVGDSYKIIRDINNSDTED